MNTIYLLLAQLVAAYFIILAGIYIHRFYLACRIAYLRKENARLRALVEQKQ